MMDIVKWLRREVPHCNDPSDYDKWDLRMLEAADEIEQLREALRPDDKLIGEIAHILTGLSNAVCCHRSGGYGGSDARPNCECREFGKQIAELYEARAALGEGWGGLT